MTDTETIGHTLKLARVAARLSQGTLAEALGVTTNWLSLVENGRREPSLTFLRKVATHLNVPLGRYLYLALARPNDTPPWRERTAP